MAAAAPGPPADDTLTMPTQTFEEVAQRIDRYWPIIDRVAQIYQVPQSLIQAVIHQESGGNPQAYRGEPAIGDASYGLMQLLKRTAEAVAGHKVTIADLYKPEVNIDLGTKYLKQLYLSYGSWRVALAAYNGGPRAAKRLQAGATDFPAARYAAKVQLLWERYRAYNRQKGRAKP